MVKRKWEGDVAVMSTRRTTGRETGSKKAVQSGLRGGKESKKEVDGRAVVEEVEGYEGKREGEVLRAPHHEVLVASRLLAPRLRCTTPSSLSVPMPASVANPDGVAPLPDPLAEAESATGRRRLVPAAAW